MGDASKGSKAVLSSSQKKTMRPFTHPKWFHEFHPSGGVNASPLFKAFVTGNNCNNCNAALVARSNAHTSTIVIMQRNPLAVSQSLFLLIHDDFRFRFSLTSSPVLQPYTQRS